MPHAASKTNESLAELFEEMSVALDLLGENQFKAIAHGRVARFMLEFAEDVNEFVRRDEATAEKRLEALPVIGAASAGKILEYLRTGRIAEHDELMAQIPPGLFGVLAIPGLGPKTVRVFWKNLGITSVDELKAKLDSPELAALPRMGAKTIAKIKASMEFAANAGDRLPLGVAAPLSTHILRPLARIPGIVKIAPAGSLRRGKETIGDLDFVAAAESPEAGARLREKFTTMPGVLEVIASGPTKCAVRMEVEKRKFQADLRIVDHECFGAALLYFTGSKEFNVMLRQRAIAAGMRLNEYGLFRGLEEKPQEKGAQAFASATEEQVLAALGLPAIPPELREDWRDPEAALPSLIRKSDIKAELHAHTTASDGKLTIEELARCAAAHGFHTIAVTDHSVSQGLARGLDPARLRKHIEAVHRVRDKTDDIIILAGSEVDILPDGSLDYEDSLLEKLDLVVASPHSSLAQDPDKATQRLLKAIAHPLVHILGHPTGRLIGSREGLRPDIVALTEAAARHNTALEINANYRRLDLRDTHVRMGLERGCVFAIDTDAHGKADFEQLVYGVTVARRAGMEPASCLNTWSAKKLHEWLKNKRA